MDLLSDADSEIEVFTDREGVKINLKYANHFQKKNQFKDLQKAKSLSVDEVEGLSDDDSESESEDEEAYGLSSKLELKVLFNIYRYYFPTALF